MSYELRRKLVDIAGDEVGTVEHGRNTGKRVMEYQASTDYGKQSATGWPWCAAFVCWCIREWGKNPEVLAALKKTPAQFEKWRPKTAAAFGFIDWAKKNGLQILNDSSANTLHAGDIIVFDMSHIGIVADDKGDTVYTHEGNTGATGGRDGDGVWSKVRRRYEARCFIRILP